MEASARKKKRPLAAIPENLEELSKPELIKIIKSLQSQVQKKQRSDNEVERALLEARERCYRTNSKVVSKRIVGGLHQRKLQKGILPASIPACQRDELDDAARPLSTAAEAFSSLVETLEGDDIKDRSRLMCT